jgi:hypothetical protein
MKKFKKTKSGDVLYRNKKGEYKLYNPGDREHGPYYSDDPMMRVSMTAPTPFEALKLHRWYTSDMNFFFYPLRKWKDYQTNAVTVLAVQLDPIHGHPLISTMDISEYGVMASLDDELDWKDVKPCIDKDYQDIVKTIFDEALEIKLSNELKNLL